MMKSKHGRILDWLELTGLWNLGIARPILDLLANQWQFFTARRSTPTEIVLLVATLCFLFPFLLFLLQRLIQQLKGIILFFLLTLLMLLGLRPLSSSVAGGMVLILAFILSAGTLAAYVRFPAVRSFFRFLAPAVVVVPALFLYHPSIQELIYVKNEILKPVAIHRKVPVVFIIFDELPTTSLLNAAGKIDSVRYPNFARLAARSTWFPNATTIADQTAESVIAIQTGLYPVKNKRANDFNLFTMLGHSYEMKVFEAVTSTCPKQFSGENATRAHLFQRMPYLFLDLSALFLHLFSPSDFREKLPSLADTWGNFWGEETRGNEIDQGSVNNRTEVVQRFIHSIQPGSRPALYYIHLMFPHGPFEFFPSGKRYQLVFGDMHRFTVERLYSNAVWKEDDWAVIQGYQRHLLQLGFTDQLLGKILDRLEETGIFEEALVIAISDHGVSFRAGLPRRDATKETYQDIAPILLMIKTPHQQQGEISPLSVDTLDILPTIVDVLDIRPAKNFDGRSVFDPNYPRKEKRKIFCFGRRARQSFIEYSSLSIIQNSSFKQKLFLFDSDTGYERLFQIGRFSSLIGKPITVIKATKTPDCKIQINNQTAFDHVDLASDSVPAFINGKLHFPEPHPNPLYVAIAVNGIIQATTRTFLVEPDVHGFGGVVSENSFQNGKNKVEILLL